MSDQKHRPPLPSISRQVFDDKTETDSPEAPRLPAITKPTFNDKTQRDSPTELATMPGDVAPEKPAPGALGGAPPPPTGRNLPPPSLNPADYAGRGLDDLGVPAESQPRIEMEMDAHGRLVAPGKKQPMITPAHGVADLLKVGVESWPTAPDPATKPYPAAGAAPSPSPVVRPPERREPPRPQSPGKTPKRDSGGGLPPLRRDVPGRPQAASPGLVPPKLDPHGVPEIEASTVVTGPRAGTAPAVDEDQGVEEADPGELTPMPARPRRRGAWLALKVALPLIVIGGAALYLLAEKPPALSSLLEVRSPATLEIRSRPSGATVTIDGEVVGTTPLVKENTYPTDRDTEIQVSSRGYKTWAWKFRGGKSFSLEVELRR